MSIESAKNAGSWSHCKARDLRAMGLQCAAQSCKIRASDGAMKRAVESIEEFKLRIAAIVQGKRDQRIARARPPHRKRASQLRMTGCETSRS
jgi:hypothetical protein